MNNEILNGNWNIAKGKIKQYWGKITEDDMKEIEGNRDEIYGVLQKRYGYTKDEADKELSKLH